MMEIATIKEVLEEIQKSLSVVNAAIDILIEDLKEAQEPEDEQRGRLERFTSAELNKILDNFCEQMGIPLPVKTKNEIVANIALEQAKTVAADRLSQAMKESEE